MSIALMTMARKTALPTNEKFVLMALADWADDNGTNCWPSVYELSEYLTCSERTVQRLLRELEDSGWIAVVGNHQGGGTSRNYALNTPKMDAASQVEHARREAEKERRRRERKSERNPFTEGCQSVTPDKLSPVTTTTQGVTSATQGVTTTTSRGDTGVTLSTIDPPYIHQRSTNSVSASAPTTPPTKPAPAAKPKTDPKPAKPTGIAQPDGVCPQVWADFLQIRKAKRSPLTATALAGIEREAAKAGIGLQQALEVCCESGWAGFKAEWLQGRQSSAQRAQVGQPQSFAQQDREAGWARWEEMTGRVHPDRAAAQQMRPVQDFVIDASAGLVAGSAVFPVLEG